MRLEAVSREALLQASRRLDWRFLLPEPDLRRVACLAGSDPDLIESLLLFSEELHVVESLSGAEVEPPYDLVVLANPSGDVLDACTGLLRPAGWVYLEVGASLRGKLGHPSRSAQGYGRALRRLGFVDVATYAHWPDFESCRAIVPLDDAAAVRHGLARGRIKGPRVLMRLAPALATLRQLALFVPCASVLGRRPLTVEDLR